MTEKYITSWHKLYYFTRGSQKVPGMVVYHSNGRTYGNVYIITLLERKKSTKWYLKLFKRLLNVAIHNKMVIYRCLPDTTKKINKTAEVQTFISSRSRGKTQFWCSSPCIRPSISWAAASKTYRTFPRAYSRHKKEGKTSNKMCSVHKTWTN
jgi:hypothetical protein